MGENFCDKNISVGRRSEGIGKRGFPEWYCLNVIVVKGKIGLKEWIKNNRVPLLFNKLAYFYVLCFVKMRIIIAPAWKNGWMKEWLYNFSGKKKISNWIRAAKNVPPSEKIALTNKRSVSSGASDKISTISNM